MKITKAWRSNRSLDEGKQQKKAKRDPTDELYEFILKVSKTQKGRKVLEEYMVGAMTTTSVSDARSVFSISTL